MKKRPKRSNQILALCLILPAIIIYAWMVLYPSIQTLYISFTDWEGIGPKDFVGLENYRHIFQSGEWDIISRAFKNNVIWALVISIVPVWAGLVLSAMIVRHGKRSGKFLQLIYFLPQVVSLVVSAIAWSWMYNPLTGPMKVIMKVFGFSVPAGLLGTKDTVIPALLVMDFWLTFGFCCLVYTSAIQNIDNQLYEAARIDGANPVQEFFRITVPSVRGTTTTVTLLMMISSFKVFDLIYTTTNGGPNNASMVISLYAYKEGFLYNHMGYAAAITVLFSILLLIVSQTFSRIRERKE